MNKEPINYKVTLIGEQDLSKLSADELDLLVTAYIAEMREHFSLPNDDE
jgi:hypothetical protein